MNILKTLDFFLSYLSIFLIVFWKKITPVQLHINFKVFKIQIKLNVNWKCEIFNTYCIEEWVNVMKIKTI